MDTHTKERLLSLRLQDYSVGEIVKRTGVPKSTVYGYVHHIPLSQEHRNRVRAANTVTRVAYNQSWRGRSRADRHPIPFLTWTPELVLLVSHLLFDGEIKHGTCAYNNRCLVLIERFEALMPIVYPFPAKRWKNELTGVWKTAFCNVELVTLMREKSAQLLLEIETMPRNLQYAFLRAFFDDEGNVYFQPKRNRRTVRGYQHNKDILLLVQRLLRNLGIAGKLENKDREISITKRANLEQFAREINFSPGLCVNGERSNSIWKESLEKREILSRALASYLG